MPAPRLTHEVLLALLALLAALFGIEDAAAFNDEAEAPIDRTYRAAVGFLHRNLNDLALDEYRKYLEAAPKSHEHYADGLYGLAIAASRSDDAKTAIKALSSLSEYAAYPRAVEARVLLGQILLKAKKYEQAADTLASVAELADKHALHDDAAALQVEALYLHGAMNEVGRAGASFVRRHAKSPHAPRVNYFLADALFRTEDFPPAIQAAKRVLRAAEDGPLADAAQLVLARCYRAQGEARTAIDAYKALADRDSGALREDVLYELAQLHAAENQDADAAKRLDDLLESFPDSEFAANATLQRAQLALRSDDPQAARRFAKSAGKRDAKLKDNADYVIAKGYLAEGKNKKAVGLLAELLERGAKPFAAIRYDYALALLNLDKPKQALDVIANSRDLADSDAMRADILLLKLRAAAAIDDGSLVIATGRDFLTDFATHEQADIVRVMVAEHAAQAGDHKLAATLLEAAPKSGSKKRNKKLADQAQLRRALSLRATDRADEAEPILRDLAERNRDAEIGYIASKTLAGLLTEKENWQEAGKVWREVRDRATKAEERHNAALQLGICESRQGNYEAALSALKPVVKSGPKNPHYELALFERGQAFLALKKLDDASKCFNAILRDSQDQSLREPARRHLAYIAQAQGNVTLAAQHLEDLADKSGNGRDAADGAFLRAAALAAKGKDERALEAFDTFARKFKDDPRRVEAQARAAITTARLGRYAEAVKRIERIDDSDLSNAALRDAVQFANATSLSKLGRADAAKETLDRLAKKATDAALRRAALIERASININAKAYEQAEKDLRAARALNTDDTKLDDSLAATMDYYEGICAFHRDDYETAAAALQRYFSAADGDTISTGAHLYAGESLFKLGRFADALPYLEEATGKKADASEQSAALLRIGETHAQLQQWRDSEAAFDRYLERFADQPLAMQARFGVAWAQENMSRFPEAIENYRRVADADKSERAARAQFQLGECLFALKDHETALRELLKVEILYAYPQWSAAALYEAARCLESLGRDTDARRQYGEVSEKYSDTRWARLSRERMKSRRPQLPGRGSAGE